MQPSKPSTSEIRPAFFDSWCIKCEDDIVQGEGIRFDPDYGVWVHEDCIESEE